MDEPTSCPAGASVSILPRPECLIVSHSGCAEELLVSYRDLERMETLVCPCGQRLLSRSELIAQLEGGLASGVSSPFFDSTGFIEQTLSALRGG